MNTTAESTTVSEPRQSALPHDLATRLAATEYERMVAALAGLEENHWHLPTDCPDWDVRELACHMVGMTAMAASPFESIRQQRRAKRDQSVRGGQMVDSLTALQVAERADRTPAEILAEARKVAPRGSRGRRAPALVRRQTLGEAQVIGGVPERWKVGYMLDVILTRDPWMHRIDLARATGQALHLTADHDGTIVDDVVSEWAGRHGRPFTLVLTGPAGGQWSSASEQGERPAISMDAIEFCRTVSGRATGEGLLATQVPF